MTESRITSYCNFRVDEILSDRKRIGQLYDPCVQLVVDEKQRPTTVERCEFFSSNLCLATPYSGRNVPCFFLNRDSFE